jgi:MoxR-like ATPase
MRALDLFKAPGIAETIDWAHALVALDATALDAARVAATLGVLLKHQDDIARMNAGDTDRLLEGLRTRALLD